VISLCVLKWVIICPLDLAKTHNNYFIQYVIHFLYRWICRAKHITEKREHITHNTKYKNTGQRSKILEHVTQNTDNIKQKTERRKQKKKYRM
jgi:hypothetical protein